MPAFHDIPHVSTTNALYLSYTSLEDHTYSRLATPEDCSYNKVIALAFARSIMVQQSPLPSPSSVSSRRRYFQRSKASSCPSLFGVQSPPSKGLSLRGIPECEYFPKTPPPCQDSPTSSFWSSLRFSDTSSSIIQKEHWNSFHKRFQSTPPDKLERIYRPGWSNTSDPIIFDRQAHEQQRQENAATASPNLIVRLVNCMFLDCTRRSTSSSSLEDDDDGGGEPSWETDAIHRHREIRNSRSFLSRWNRMEHDYSLTE
jgi:hypothetical protein